MRLRYLGGIAAAGLTACAVVLLYISQVKAPVDSESLYISSVTPPAEFGPCITASDGRPMGSAYLDMDASLGAIAREIPVFAGLWRGAQLTVAVTDLDVDRVQLADAIARQFGPRIFDPAGFKLVKAEYSFTQLAAWYDCMRDPVWSTGGVITTDVDEQGNRIRIEATSAETRRAMEQAVAALGIPVRAVLIEVRQPVLGPAPGPDEQVLAHRLLASENRLPSRHVMRGEDVIMKLADDQQRYEELWRLFGMTGETLGQTKVPPAIDWAKESVLFVGLGESGSCPMRLTAVSLEPGGRLRPCKRTARRLRWCRPQAGMQCSASDYVNNRIQMKGTAIFFTAPCVCKVGGASLIERGCRHEQYGSHGLRDHLPRSAPETPFPYLVRGRGLPHPASTRQRRPPDPVV